MRHATNYVCFPCRRNARAQRRVGPRVGWDREYAQVDYGPDPKCPGCGGKMLSWRGKVPTGEDWDKREDAMVSQYIKWKERASPFHPQHWKYKFGFGGWEHYESLIGHPCAPKFFQALKQ